MFSRRRFYFAGIWVCLGILACQVLFAQADKDAATAKEEAKTEAKADAPSPPADTAKAADPAAPTQTATDAPAPTAGDEKKEEAAPATDPEVLQSLGIDTMWVILTGCLVMWMQAGFALVETGLTRAKNAVNICMKNLLDFCFGSVAYWAVGFSIMFGVASTPEMNKYWGGLNAMFIKETREDVKQDDGTMKNVSTNLPGIDWPVVPLEAKFFFQLVFAATTATIVSGAMAERTKFTSYMIYSFIVSAVIYPISGHWIWGLGWLADAGFWDFAGSTVVHSLGGWLALAGAIVIGPRLGKYTSDGKVRAIPGHNIVIVALGVFILWLGWFGFNPGSTMGISGGTGATDVARITIVTNLSAAVGCIFALFTARLMFGKWEATMAMNGALAGLVGITAPCMWISMEHAFIVGAVAGVLVVLSVVFFDSIAKVDDPVGAISVHGVCGAWGTLALGLFSTGTGDLSPKPGLFVTGGSSEQLIMQVKGVIAVMVWGLVSGAILFTILKYTVGLRVSAVEEQEGLDIGEHGNEAYHGFAFTSES